MNLYQMTTDFTRYMEADDEDGIGNALAEITAGQIEEKAEHWCHFLANVEGEIEKFKAEEKRISTIRKAMENKVERGKEYIKAAMFDADIDKINAGTFKISLTKTAGSVIIDDMEAIPAMFKTIVSTVTVDKNELKEAIKSGVLTKGCHIQSGVSLRIK